jgi:hypothetical protein
MGGGCQEICLFLKNPNNGIVQKNLTDLLIIVIVQLLKLVH